MLGSFHLMRFRRIKDGYGRGSKRAGHTRKEVRKTADTIAEAFEQRSSIVLSEEKIICRVKNGQS